MHRSRSQRQLRGRGREQGTRTRTSSTAGSSEGTGGDSDRPPPNGVTHWRERERPGPSVVWQTVAIVFVGFAFAAGIGALTVPPDAAVRVSELWISAAAFATLALACFLAHWDVNRGRRHREYETERLP